MMKTSDLTFYIIELCNEQTNAAGCLQ